jgi:PST family polysaccharide transporter
MKSDVFWSALEAAWAALFSIAGAFLIARLIGPEELGVGAAAVAVHVLLWVAVNALFADAIVQRASIDDDMLSSAAWASTAVGCGASIVQGASGWLLAWMLNDDRLIPMGLILALPLPFVGMGGALQGLLTRQRGYRLLAMRTCVGQSVGMVIGVGLAVRHAGAWSLVAQQASGSLLSALVLIGAAGWRPRVICQWSSVRSLLRIGLPLTASTLVQIGRYRIFAVMIGGTAGAAALGQIHLAFRLADTVREITFTALWRLMLPILAEHQSDRAELLRQVDRLLLLSSAVTMPMCGGMALALGPVTTLVLGPEWHQAGLAAEPLVGLTALLALMFPSGAALVAAGQARFTLYANLAGLGATIVAVLLIRPSTPWEAVWVWCGAQCFVSPYSLWVNGRALGVSMPRPLRPGIPMLLISAFGIAAALALDEGGSLPRRLAVFVAVVSVCSAAMVWRASQYTFIARLDRGIRRGAMQRVMARSSQPMTVRGSARPHSRHTRHQG